MSAAFIIDCSLAMAWLFKDEATDKTTEVLERLATETGLVPAWWFLEVTNVIALAERKGRIAPPESQQFVTDLSRLDIEIDTESPSRSFSHILPLCRGSSLTSYDAMYIELALRRDLPLATLDERLRKAAKKAGVKLLGR